MFWGKKNGKRALSEEAITSYDYSEIGSRRDLLTLSWQAIDLD